MPGFADLLSRHVGQRLRPAVRTGRPADAESGDTVRLRARVTGVGRATAESRPAPGDSVVEPGRPATQVLPVRGPALGGVGPAREVQVEGRVGQRASSGAVQQGRRRPSRSSSRSASPSASTARATSMVSAGADAHTVRAQRVGQAGQPGREAVRPSRPPCRRPAPAGCGPSRWPRRPTAPSAGPSRGAPTTRTTESAGAASMPGASDSPLVAVTVPSSGTVTAARWPRRAGTPSTEPGDGNLRLKRENDGARTP